MADRSMGDRIFQGLQGGAAIVGGTMIGKYDGRVARFTLKPAMIGLGGILLADALMRTSSAKAESAKPAAPPAPKAEASKEGSSFNTSAALWSAATLSNVGAMAVGLKMGSPGLIALAGASATLTATLAASSSAKAESAKPAAPSASPVKSMNSALDSAISAHDAHMVAKGKQPVAAPKLSGRDGTMDAAAIAGGGAVGAAVAAVPAYLMRNAPVGKVVTAGAAVGAAAALAMVPTSAKAEPAKPSATPTAADNVGKAVDAGFATAMTAKAVQLMANPAVRAGASILSKAAVPLTIGAAAIGAYQGYQKDGLSGIALGAADGVTGGGVSAGLAYLNSSAEKKAAAAPAPIKAPAPQAAQVGSTGGEGGMKSYTTADGRSVQGTAAQIASWEGRKK